MQRKILTLYTVVMAILSLASVVLVILNFLGTIEIFSYPYFFIDSLITFLFLIDYILRFINSKNKKEFFKRNIPGLMAVLPIIPILKVLNFREFVLLWAVLKFCSIAKIIRLIRILHFASGLRKKTVRFLYTNGFIYALYVTFSFMILSSVLISYLENWTFSQSMWFSFVTCATVGYGDMVPLSSAGKVIAVILMLFGVALLSMLTGTVTSYFSHKAEAKKLIHKKNITALLDVCSSFSQEEIDLLTSIAKNISSGSIEISMKPNTKTK